MPSGGEAESMIPAPAVRCCSCEAVWNSAAMVDGLRLLGSCPKCGGTLEFHGEAPAPERFDRPKDAVAPHLVLGIPRR